MLHPFYADSAIEIQVDTTQVLALEENIWGVKKEINILYGAYPAIIKNNSDSIIVVGFGRNIPVILEALDIDK